MSYQIQLTGEKGSSSFMSRNKPQRSGKRAEIPDEIAKKLKSCSVTGCEDWRDLTSYTTYHCFPTGAYNQDRWEIWTQLLRKARDDSAWIPFRGSLVCSHHFRPEDFVNDPYSKRRKLIKNAIPSIFPTFTVDLNDPSYKLPDIEESNGNDTASGQVYAEVDPASFFDMDSMIGEGEDYEYQTESNQSQDQTDDDDDIQILEENPPQLPAIRSSFPPPVKVLQVNRGGGMSTATTSSSSSRNSNGATITSLGQIQIMSPQAVTLNKQLQPVQIGKSQITMIPASQAHLVPLPSSDITSVQQPQRNFQNFSIPSHQKSSSRKSSLGQEEAIAAIRSLPISLNPDLDIEVVDPEEDLAAYRQRISELEQENRSLITMYENEIDSLKQNYEFEIEKLHRQLRQQEKLLSMNQISLTPPSKKIRLS